MDQINPQRPAPRWFTAAAVGIMLFELAGCAIYLIQVSAEPTLADEIALSRATPAWVTASFAVAVFAGLIGAILLFLRRRSATTLLLVSLAAVITLVSAYLLVPALRNLTRSDDLFVPFLLIVACYVIWHFAFTSRRAGWLH